MILYAAKSTEDIRRSIPGQLEDGRRFAQSTGLQVIAEYSEADVSAYSGNRGPDLAAALKHVKRVGGSEIPPAQGEDLPDPKAAQCREREGTGVPLITTALNGAPLRSRCGGSRRRTSSRSEGRRRKQARPAPSPAARPVSSSFKSARPSTLSVDAFEELSAAHPFCF